MNKYDQALEYEIFIKKEYAFADYFIQNANLIFDIGGHRGYFSKYCLSINPWVTIHYFEPIPALYQQAKLLLENQNTVVLNNVGIAAQEWTQTLYFNPQKTMQSSKYTKTKLNPDGEQIQVNMQNLEQYCTQNHIDQIDLVKMDVEGMEYEIIQSWSDDFLQKIQAIVLEFHCFDKEMETQKQMMIEKLANHFVLEYFSNQFGDFLWYVLAHRWAEKKQ